MWRFTNSIFLMKLWHNDKLKKKFKNKLDNESKNKKFQDDFKIYIYFKTIKIIIIAFFYQLLIIIFLYITLMNIY